MSAVGLPVLAVLAAEAGHVNLGIELGLWTLIPFAALLLSIAVFPLVAGHWWEHNKNKGIISAACAIPIAIYFVSAFGQTGVHNLIEKGEEYLSFMVLLTSLFVITGGIYIRGSLSGTPLANTAILGVGAMLANLIGTTGASVLLIRPLLRANQSRRRVAHVVVFFIFVVSNCGGLLTPLGDPPLFLGYLKGVPFEWTLSLWPQWLVANIILLVVFNIWDQVAMAREEKERAGSQLEEVQHHEKVGLDGVHNLLFLLGVVAAIYSSGRGLFNDGKPWPFGVQEGLMVLLCGLAFVTTSKTNRDKNRFSFGPIIEVAVLFAGIFVTMAPALAILNSWGKGEREVFGIAFGLNQSWQFFWATGLLSSVLDNAPTYLTFAATACGLNKVAVEGSYMREFLAIGPEAVKLLSAISCGAVLMGANTYIGNGPNFMVKAIAEENGIRMPSFFGYMLYSGAILIPTVIVETLIYFR